MSTAAPQWHERAAALRIDGRAVIDGQRRDAASGEAFACVSPIDGRVLGSVARGAAADIDAAVASARAAFEDARWAGKPPAARKRLLLRFAEKILAARDELALLESAAGGQPSGADLRPASVARWTATRLLPDRLIAWLAELRHARQHQRLASLAAIGSAFCSFGGLATSLERDDGVSPNSASIDCSLLVICAEGRIAHMA